MAASPLRMKGFRRAWTTEFPVGRKAHTQTEVSTRTMRLPLFSLRAKLFQRHIQGDGSQGVSQGLKLTSPDNVIKSCVDRGINGLGA